MGLPAPAETRYLLKDHLGSLDVVLDSTGLVLERLSFDAWGKRRKVDWTAYLAAEPGYVWQSTPITRGYTGHEQLDPVGLVHMNGRVYDPEIGRFLSADIVIQDVTNLQSLNAYSYVLNNPLSFTDPTGFFFSKLFRAIGNFFRAVFRAIGGVLRAVVRSSIGRAIIQIAACANPVAIYTCGAAAAGLALAAGGSVIDAVKAGAFAFAQMYIWTDVGNFLKPILANVSTFGSAIPGAVTNAGLAAATAVKSFVHGVVGGALSLAQGGSFLQGFASNAIGGAAGFLANESPLGGMGGYEGIALRTSIAATAGGLGAEVTGGKFANGALTAAMAHLYNQESANNTVENKPTWFQKIQQQVVETAAYVYDATAQVVGAAFDFGDNYLEMRNRNVIGADEYYHCRANCEATQRGQLGEATARGISDAREYTDQLRGMPAGASARDQIANQAGRTFGQNPNNVCAMSCLQLAPRNFRP